MHPYSQVFRLKNILNNTIFFIKFCQIFFYQFVKVSILEIGKYEVKQTCIIYPLLTY